MDKISIAQVCKVGVGFALGYITLKCLQSANSNGKQHQQLHKQKQLECAGMNDESKKQQQQNQTQIKSLTQLQDLLTRKAANFQVQSIPDHPQILSKRCLLDFIYETGDILSAKQIVQITQSNRLARRQVFPQIDSKYQTYFRFVCTLDENIKYILDKAQKDFSIFLNIDYKRIMESISYHIENEQNQGSAQNFKIHIVEIMSSIRQNLANYMPLFNSSITKARLKQIMDYQTQIVTKQKQHITLLTKKLGLQTKQQQESLPLFLTCYIEDSTWFKYNIESEQMSVLSEDMDNQLKQKFDIFKSKRTELIKQIHLQVQDNIIIQQ